MRIWLIVASLVVLATCGTPSFPASDTEIRFCEPEIAPELIARNLSFYAIFRFEIGEDQRPVNITAVKDSYGLTEPIRGCLEHWILPEEVIGETVSVSLYWEHGFGWKELRISSKSFGQAIVRERIFRRSKEEGQTKEE